MDMMKISASFPPWDGCLCLFCLKGQGMLHWFGTILLLWYWRDWVIQWNRWLQNAPWHHIPSGYCTKDSYGTVVVLC